MRQPDRQSDRAVPVTVTSTVTLTDTLAFRLRAHEAADVVSHVRLIDEAQADAHICRLEVVGCLNNNKAGRDGMKTHTSSMGTPTGKACLTCQLVQQGTVMSGSQ